MKPPILLLALTFFAVGCSSSSDDDAVLNDTVADEIVQEEDAIMESDEIVQEEDAIMESDEVVQEEDVIMESDEVVQEEDVIMESDEVVQEEDVINLLPRQPINVSQSYFRGTSFVSWDAPIAGPEVTGYGIIINGELIQNPEILEFESVVTRFSHPVQDPSIGTNIVEVFSSNDAGNSEASVQWVFNDLGRAVHTTNIGVVGDPLNRQFFEFPLRQISTINRDNYISMALLMMNALQVEPEARDDLGEGIDVPVQTMVDGVATTEVFLCENEGRQGFYEFRAGGLGTDFDYDAYGDCLLEGKIIDGWFNQRVFQFDALDPEIVFDEIFSLDLSALDMTNGIVSGQFLVTAFNDDSVSATATIENGFVLGIDGFWDSGVMTAIAGDGSMLTIDATTNDSRTVNYTLLNSEESISGILPWPKSDLPSPPVNIRRDSSFASDDFILWAGATDDSVGELVFEVSLDGNLIETVTEEFRDFSRRRSVFESGYFRYPSIDDAVDRIQNGMYSITTVDPDGNRSETVTFNID